MAQSKFKTLEDYLVSRPLTANAELLDGWGQPFPVKGISLNATILFADISKFSSRTKELDPLATLIFVNRFFAWITAESIQHSPCIIDKYIGDEVMPLFSKEFGSDDPFRDAIRTAFLMGRNEAWGFNPHIGIASGEVFAGFVGSPLKYNASVFGKPVTLAARCTAIEPIERSSFIVTFPAEEWGPGAFDCFLKAVADLQTEAETAALRHAWQLDDPRHVPLKNLGEVSVRQIRRTTCWVPLLTSPEDVASSEAQAIREGICAQ